MINAISLLPILIINDIHDSESAKIILIQIKGTAVPTVFVEVAL